ncbi:MAG: hypothetical protein ABI760_25310 [Ferruginibacter sp.]
MKKKMKKYKRYDFLPVAKIELKDAMLYYKLTGVKGISKRFSQAVKAAIGQVKIALKNEHEEGQKIFCNP